MKRTLSFSTIILLSLLIISSCKKLSSYDYESSKVSAYEIIADDPYNYSLFKYVIDRANMTSQVKDGDYTIFAPTNSAFFGAGYSTNNLQNIPLDTLAIIVRNHLVKGAVDLNAITSSQMVTNENGGPIFLQKIGGRLYADGADITSQSANVNKGALNTINKFIVNGYSIYDRLSKFYSSSTNNQLTIFIAAVNKASLGSVDYRTMLSDPNANYTVFAPTNLAFIKAGYATVAAATAANSNTLGAILANHIVPNKKFLTELDTTQSLTALSGISIFADRILSTNRYTYFYENGLSISGGGANMPAGASLINIIPAVMPVPLTVTTLAKIQSDPNLTFFNKALEVGTAAGKYNFVNMVSSSTERYTVFAINNLGFQANGYPTLQSVADANPTTISNMLLYHFAMKRLHSLNYADNGGMGTLYFQNNLIGPPSMVSITISNTPAYKVKGPSNPVEFTVSQPNTVTTNGMLNVIQGILMP